LIDDLSKRISSNTLWPDVLARVTGPLWVGSTMWRPLPYASFALDALLWGHVPTLWRATNLALHAGCAALTGLVVAQITTAMATDTSDAEAHVTTPAMAGAAAYSVFLLAPWVPEVSLWIVGRFDGWATMAVLLALWFTLKSSGRDRWLLLSLIAAAAAYASKESALLLPAWILLMRFTSDVVGATAALGKPAHPWFVNLRKTLQTHALTFVAHGLLACGYLLWRAHLFSGAATNVYSSAPLTDVATLATRLVRHVSFPAGLAQAAPIAAWTVAICALAVVAVAWRAGRRPALLVGSLLVLSVLSALAMYLSNPPGAGEGYRLYYLTGVGAAVALAAGRIPRSKLNTLLWLPLVLSLAIWQSQVAAEWTHASVAMRHALKALRASAKSQPASDYGLVLMPDMVGRIPFARNAQVGMLAHASYGLSDVAAISHLIIFTPPQFAEWHHLAQASVVKHLTQRAEAPPQPTRFYCFDPTKPGLQHLGYWPTDMLAAWTARWRECATAACPNLKL
jgi:hypothetical protein